MTPNSDRSDLQRQAASNAGRLARQLHHFQDDFTRVCPADPQGAALLADAVAAVNRVVEVLRHDDKTDPANPSPSRRTP